MRVISSVILLVAAGCAAATDPPQSAYLDVQERFYIEWDYSDTNITILARVNTTGWFGIGFSPKGGMAGSDIITAGVKDGVPYLQDRYAERNGYPALDQSQDVHLISGSEVDGTTTIKFTRKHNTCDDKDLVVETDTMRIIYAISPDGSDNLQYHQATNRGTRSLYLRKKLGERTPSIPDDAFTYDITVDNIDIPAFHTRYYCEVKRVPKLAGKHHMIKVEPIIDESNLGIVHHIIVYGCYDKIDRDHYFVNNNTRGFDCYEGNMPDDLNVCKKPAVVWAIGGGPQYFPEEAGFPFGDDASPDYYMMEVHYDNPQLISGKKDNSGMRMTLTKNLRPNDAAILNIGAVHGIAIPPGVTDFQFSGICTSDCTSRLVKEPTKIFGAFLHGHLAATQVIARQFRDGKELRIIDEDRKYDFNYQQYKNFETALDFLPGDSFMSQCHYNTEKRTKMTYGGLPSSNEMCITFLAVYPPPDIAECYSAPGWAADSGQAAKFVKNNLGYSVNPNWFTVMFDDITATGGWTPKRIDALEKGHLNYDAHDLCSTAAYKHIGGWGQKRFTPIDAMKINVAPRDYSRECQQTPDAAIGK